MLQNSITEYVVYGEKTHNRYVIGKMGICFNKSYEAKPNFGKWYISCNIDQGTGKFLLNTSEWIVKVDHSKDSKCWFDTPEQALNILQNSIDEKLENNLEVNHPQTALEAFEEHIRNDPTKGIAPEIFLKKIKSIDPANPEFLHHCIDFEWQTWLKAWNVCLNK